MGNALKVWAITGGTLELTITPNEDNSPIFWIDQRDQFGRLDSAESFDSESAARDFALAIVDAESRKIENSGFVMA